MAFDPISDRTTHILKFALDGLQLRQEAIANNLSNLETPGYKAIDVTFEDALKQAAGADDELQLTTTDPRHFQVTIADLDDKHPIVVASQQTSVRNDGNNVDIDAEMSKLAETQIAFNALAQLTTAKLGMVKAAIFEGRR